jgi:hypothetical protein
MPTGLDQDGSNGIGSDRIAQMLLHLAELLSNAADEAQKRRCVAFSDLAVTQAEVEKG